MRYKQNKQTRACDMARAELFKAVAKRDAEEREAQKQHDRICSRALGLSQGPRDSKWWMRFVAADIPTRLMMLKARANGKKIAKDAGYHNRRAVKQPARGKCEVCGLVATCRHHITPLINGGSNKEDNLINICNSCHCEVHTWITPETPDWVKDMDKSFSDTIGFTL